MSRMTAGSTALLVVAALALPSTADAGFFDQLFGGGQTHSFFENQPGGYDIGQPVRRRVHHPRKVVEEKPAVQTPTDIMHDKTLRYGDAVMTASGIKIYTGGHEYSHDDEDFAPLQSAPRMNPREKLALAEINAARTGVVIPPKPDKSATNLVTGRSAAVVTPTPVAENVMTTDRDGKKIRYVGP